MAINKKLRKLSEMGYWQTPKPLGGRLRFFVQSRDGHDVGEALYQIVFDALGNTRLGKEKSFSSSIRPDAEGVEQTHRKIALNLSTAIHDGIDSIDCNA